jgi:hypothetical protein
MRVARDTNSRARKRPLAFLFLPMQPHGGGLGTLQAWSLHR